MAQFSVTIPTSKVPSSQTDFQVLVDLSNMPAEFWAVVAGGGGDIRVYLPDGTTELAREVAYCDTATSTGELWVRVANLSALSDTAIIIDVDGARADYEVTSTYGRNAVWIGWTVVWHYNEDPSGTAPQIIDSTGNGYDGTTGGGMTSADSVSGTIGKGLELDGIDDYIRVPSGMPVLSGSQSRTVSAWYKSTQELPATIFSHGDTTTATWDHERFDISIEAGSWQYALRTSNGNQIWSNFDLDNGLWHHIAITMPEGGGTDDLIGYLDAGLSNKKSGSSTAVDTQGGAGEHFRVGDLTIGNTKLLDGTVDELRVSSIQRSADWIAAEYNNQSDPSTFYTIAVIDDGGGADPEPLPGTAVMAITSQGKIRATRFVQSATVDRPTLLPDGTLIAPSFKEILNTNCKITAGGVITNGFIEGPIQ